MPGTTIKIRSTRRRRVRLLPGDARDRRQGAGDRARLRRPRRRQGHPRDRRRIRLARLHRRRARPVLAHRAGAAWPRRRPRRRRARSRASRRSRPAKPTWPIRWPTCARCRSSTDAPRRWASATAAPTRSSVRSGWATTPASPATARRCSTYIGELDGVTQPVCIIWGDQDHAAPPPVQEAYRAVPARMKNVEVHIFPGVQHGYMMPGNAKALRSEDARLLHGARARDPRRAARWRREAAPSLVTSLVTSLVISRLITSP